MMGRVFPLYEQYLSILTAGLTWCVITHTRKNTHILTPVHTNFEAQITQSPTSVQKYFKKTFSHYRVTFYRKLQICRPVAYVSLCSLISSWQRTVVS